MREPWLRHGERNVIPAAGVPLPPPQKLNRYHSLQADSDRREQQRRRIDEENSRTRQEQHRLLGFERVAGERGGQLAA
jgi:hypothetical protein